MDFAAIITVKEIANKGRGRKVEKVSNYSDQDLPNHQEYHDKSDDLKNVLYKCFEHDGFPVMIAMNADGHLECNITTLMVDGQKNLPFIKEGLRIKPGIQGKVYPIIKSYPLKTEFQTIRNEIIIVM